MVCVKVRARLSDQATAKEVKNRKAQEGLIGYAWDRWRMPEGGGVGSANEMPSYAPKRHLSPKDRASRVCGRRRERCWRGSSVKRGARSGDAGKVCRGEPSRFTPHCQRHLIRPLAAMRLHLVLGFVLIWHSAAVVDQRPSSQEVLSDREFLGSFPLHLLADDDPYPKRPGHRIPVPALYHKRYSEQTFIGTHNSAAIRTAENGYSLSGNQYFNVSVQLNAGVRLLQAQGHASPDGSADIRLCHFNCALMDGGLLTDHLLTVKHWLDDNPHEVVTLLFVNTGPALWRWAKAYYDSGLDLMSYVPPRKGRWGNFGIEDWPTIADMVASNQRVVTFISSGANEYAVPFLLPEFRYLFETNFGIERPDQYTCRPDRPRWPGSFIPNRLSMIDHWLYAKFLGFRYPNATYANETNSASFREGALGEHAARCRTTYQRRPNFLLVDFFNEGDVFDVEFGMNAN